MREITINFNYNEMSKILKRQVNGLSNLDNSNFNLDSFPILFLYSNSLFQYIFKNLNIDNLIDRLLTT